MEKQYGVMKHPTNLFCWGRCAFKKHQHTQLNTDTFYSILLLLHICAFFYGNRCVQLKFLLLGFSPDSSASFWHNHSIRFILDQVQLVGEIIVFILSGLQLCTVQCCIHTVYIFSFPNSIYLQFHIYIKKYFPEN